MLILEASKIKKYFGDRLVLDFNELRIYLGDKIGVVGQNGSGKTTLLNILSKELEPDEGFVKTYCTISYIRQLSDEAIETDPKRLSEFNLTDKYHQKVMSGGEVTRLKIANALSNDHLILFADEPTSNLDYKGIDLLKQKFSELETFMIISHDRELLDTLCNQILEVKDGKIKMYSGNFTSYMEQKEIEDKQQELEYEKYISERDRLKKAIQLSETKSKSMRKAPKRMGNSEARLHKGKASEKKKKLDQSGGIIKSRLERLEVKEKPREITQIKLDFSLTNPPENRIVISANDLSFSYGSKNILKKVKFEIYNGSKTVLWGENGSGKTTLMNLINQAKTDESLNIRIAPKANIGYFQQNLENLELDKSILENVIKESIQSQTVVRTILSRLLFCGDDVYKKVGILSGGERIKVSFAKLFVSEANVLLLDEPTNYLDMKSIEALESVLKDYEGTVLFVSHDRKFVNAIANRVLVIDNQVVKDFKGNLNDYYLESQKPSKEETLIMSQKLILQMKITEVITKLSVPSQNKEALEIEYEELILKLKQLELSN